MSATVDGWPRPWRTAGEFAGSFESPTEFRAQGSATETPMLAGNGDGLLTGELVVRGSLSDDGLVIGTLFVDAETVSGWVTATDVVCSANTVAFRALRQQVSSGCLTDNEWVLGFIVLNRLP